MAASKEDIAELVKAIKSLESTMKKCPSSNAEATQSNEVEKRRTQNRRRDTSMGLLDRMDTGAFVAKRKVFIRVVFLKVGEIDTIREKYAADIFFHGRWREPKFDNERDMDPEEVDWDKQWTPSLMVENALADVKEESWYAVTHDELGRAWVYEKRRVKGSFLEYLELNQFPFDTQDLTITVASERGETEVEMTEDTEELSGVNVQSFVAEQEWHLHETVHSWTKLTTKVFQNAKHKHPALSTAVKASRRPGFFIWNVLFVMLFICSLSFATFAVEINLIPNRLQLSFILLLTTVTFKFVVTHNLPKISYLTYLDKYILSAMSILCSISVWHVIVYKYYEKFDRKEENPEKTPASKADFIAFCVLMSIWVFFQIFFFVWVLCISRYNKRRVSKKQSKDNKKSDDTVKMLNNSVKPSNEFKYTSNKRKNSKTQIETVEEVDEQRDLASMELGTMCAATGD